MCACVVYARVVCTCVCGVCGVCACLVCGVHVCACVRCARVVCACACKRCARVRCVCARTCACGTTGLISGISNTVKLLLPGVKQKTFNFRCGTGCRMWGSCFFPYETARRHLSSESRGERVGGKHILFKAHPGTLSELPRCNPISPR